jgi:iron complex transport system substrate-binding protein
MNRSLQYTCIALLLVAAFVMCAACTGQTGPAEATPAPATPVTEAAAGTTTADMLGRTVEIPTRVDGVLSTAPHVTVMVYMIAPDQLMGWNWKPDGDLVPEKYANLPVVGGWYGKQSGNYETFISMAPDIVFEGYNAKGDPLGSIEERQDNFGDIPVVGVENSIDALAYDAPVEYLGSVIGAEAEAAELAEFYARVLSLVQEATADIPGSEKRTVYYANGPTGLKTSPSGSQHCQLIDIANGVNIAECPMKSVTGQTEVSLEQVAEWNPDVIICDNRAFYDSVYEDELWQEITAVKNGEVHYTPYSPFCWFDFPPSTNTIIGIPWTASVIYPDRCENIDMEGLTREFYAKFYHIDLTDAQVQQLLNP